MPFSVGFGAPGNRNLRGFRRKAMKSMNSSVSLKMKGGLSCLLDPDIAAPGGNAIPSLGESMLDDSLIGLRAEKGVNEHGGC
jgi:hypothetical protein